MAHTNGYPNPDPAIQALKQAVNLIELVEAAGVKLEGTAPEQKGLCPIHPEKTPSFTVDGAKQVWHCWGCGKGGDVFDFLAAKDGMAFPQAVAHLRKLTGLLALPKARRTSRAAGSHASPPAPADPPVATDLPTPAAPPAPTDMTTDKPDKAESWPGGFTRQELMGRVVALYQTRLNNTQEGQAYLKQRHLDSPELWEAFRIGYADGALLNTMGKDSEVKAALQALGVVTREGKELLYGCVVVPLEDPDGGVVGLYGRRIWPDATVPHLYLPGPRQGILNAQAFKASAHIILTESVLDALSVWVAGHRNVTCIYGANGFTRQHDDLLERFGTQQVTFCLDNDEVGEKATQALLHKLSARRIQCVTVSLPVKDANAMLCQHGPDALLKALASQPLSNAPPTEGADRTPDGFLMQWGELSYRVTPRAPSTGGRLKVALQVDLNGESYSDTITDLMSQRLRQAFAKPAARALHVSRDEVEQHLASILRETQGWVESQQTNGPEHTNPFCAPPPPPMTDDRRARAIDLLCHPRLMQIIVEHMEALGHVGDDNAKQLVYLVASSRRREEPLSAIIVSQSGAGKSTMSTLVQRLIPPEELVSLTRVSPKAFSYMPKDGVKQKTVAMEEGVGVSDDAAYAVRVLQTAPVFRSAVTKTDPATGETTTRVYEVEGPIAYIETTTNPKLNHENATRAFEITLNESIEQTRRIHDMQRQRRSEAYMLQTAATHVDPDDICCLHQDAQRLCGFSSIFGQLAG